MKPSNLKYIIKIYITSLNMPTEEGAHQAVPTHMYPCEPRNNDILSDMDTVLYPKNLISRKL